MIEFLICMSLALMTWNQWYVYRRMNLLSERLDSYFRWYQDLQDEVNLIPFLRDRIERLENKVNNGNKGQE